MRLSFKGVFILSIFVSCILLIIPCSISGKDFNVPIYIQTSAGIEKAGSAELLEILFNNNFSIELKNDNIPMDECSLRALDGSININGKDIINNNKLSFNINYLTNGQGSLTGQNNKNRFSLSFEVKDILETNSDRLVLEAEGNGKLNRKSLKFNKIILTFDRVNKKVSITGSGDLDFNVKNMDVNFIDGCLMETNSFYLIINNGKLKEQRSEKEVKTLLRKYPQFIDMYENLLESRLSNIPIIPEFNALAGALTLAGAIGIFFFVRIR